MTLRLKLGACLGSGELEKFLQRLDNLAPTVRKVRLDPPCSCGYCNDFRVRLTFFWAIEPYSNEHHFLFVSNISFYVRQYIISPSVRIETKFGIPKLGTICSSGAAFLINNYKS